jgi:hypothetical protein
MLAGYHHLVHYLTTTNIGDEFKSLKRDLTAKSTAAASTPMNSVQQTASASSAAADSSVGSQTAATSAAVVINAPESQEG